MTELDNCHFCAGRRGGTPGNENIKFGLTVCDYCSADLFKIAIEIRNETLDEAVAIVGGIKVTSSTMEGEIAANERAMLRATRVLANLKIVDGKTPTAYRTRPEDWPDVPHSSHVTRSSDASTFDEICVNCGARDVAGGGWGTLRMPCSKAIQAA